MSLFADSNRYLKISFEIMPVNCGHLKILVWYFLTILHMGIASCAMFIGSEKLQSPSLYLGILSSLVLTFENKHHTLNSFLRLICLITTRSKPLGLCCVLDGQHCKPVLSTAENMTSHSEQSRTSLLSSTTDPLPKEPLVHCRQAVQTHPNKHRTEAFAN